MTGVRAKPPPPQDRVSAARLAAAKALVAVDDTAHLDQALDQYAPPPGPDRDLAWFLGYGVVRRRGHVDAALRNVLSQPLGALDPPVRAALRIGAFEKLYARTQPHAVVHQAVEVARALGKGRAHGLVNAVLRKLEPPARIGEADALDHPAWLVARWKARYGVERTRAWCEANAEPPPLFAVAKPGWKAPDGWVPAGPPDVYRVEATGPIPAMPGFGDGAWWVQDLASVLVADLVADVVPPGSTVLDACAAPGGKSFRLASRGAQVTATDVVADRIALLSDGVRRLGLDIAVALADWTAESLDRSGRSGLQSPHAPAIAPAYDAVLVDAPCTGLGTVRRHPEIRWRRSEPDLAQCAALQRKVLAGAARRVKLGGVLVYAVCSPEPEEGAEIVAGLRELTPGATFAVDQVLETAPPSRGEDAHYAARLRRTR